MALYKSVYYYYCYFLTPILNSQGMKKLRYAIQKIQISSWNEPYSFSSFTKQSSSKMALYRWIRTESRWNKQEAQLSLSDRAMRLVSSNLANCHATVQKLLYDKSWPNWWYEVGDLVGWNVSWTMCTQPWRDRVGFHCLGCHKQTDDDRVVYITCIQRTCCGEIF